MILLVFEKRKINSNKLSPSRLILLEDESINLNKSVEDFNEYLPIALQTIADQISKKFVLVETALNKIEERIYSLNNRINPERNSKQDLSDFVKSEESKDGLVQVMSIKKKSQIEDNELLSALKFIKNGNK